MNNMQGLNNMQALNNNNEVFTNEQLNIQGLDQLTHQQTINNLHANNQIDQYDILILENSHKYLRNFV